MGGVKAYPENGEILIQSHVIGKGWLGWISSKDYSKNNKTNGNTYSSLYDKKIDMIRIKSTKGHVDYRAYDNVKTNGYHGLVQQIKANTQEMKAIQLVLFKWNSVHIL